MITSWLQIHWRKISSSKPRCIKYGPSLNWAQSAHFIMGIAVAWVKDTQTVALSQTALIDKIIEQFGQKDAHPVSAPLEPGWKLCHTNPQSITPKEQLHLNKLLYWSLISCLLYLVISTQPDIWYAVQQLSQYLNSYNIVHWNAAIRLVHYLKGIKDLKLSEAILWSPFTLLVTQTRPIAWTPIVVLVVMSALVSWTAQKQKVIAASSCEAEYIVAFEATKECVWLQTLLNSIDYTQISSPVIIPLPKPSQKTHSFISLILNTISFVTMSNLMIYISVMSIPKKILLTCSPKP